MPKIRNLKREAQIKKERAQRAEAAKKAQEARREVEATKEEVIEKSKKSYRWILILTVLLMTGIIAAVYFDLIEIVWDLLNNN